MALKATISTLPVKLALMRLTSGSLGTLFSGKDALETLLQSDVRFARLFVTG